MTTLRPMLFAGIIAVALAAHGQTTPATSTPQTNAAAPAATGSASTGAQAAEATATANSATRGAAQSKASGRQTQPAAGITGVPRYRAGYGRRQGAPAPAATAKVTITGVDDGSAPADKDQSAALQGVAMPQNAFGIARGTPIHVRLQKAVDSGHAKNGDVVHGFLTAPVGSAPQGAPVQLTVVAVASAGQISSNGELSLQVVSVNGQPVISDVITAEGKEGPKLTPDAAPGRGTEAVFPPDQPITLPAG